MKTLRELFDKLPNVDKTANILVLTHTDLDGEGIALLFSLLFENITIKHCSNAVMDKEIRDAATSAFSSYDYIFACDISCTETTAEIIEDYGNRNRLIIIDHHKTADFLNKYDWAVVYPDMVSDSFRASLYTDVAAGHSSATGLLFDYFDIKGHTARLKNIQFTRAVVETISAYDTWDWVNCFSSNPRYKAFNDLYFAYGEEIFEQVMIQRLNACDPRGFEFFSSQDKLILAIEANKQKAAVEKVKDSIKTGILTIDDREYAIAICFTAECIPSVFAYMRDTYKDSDINIIITPRTISMRTDKPNVDVSAIAKKFNGGGHTGAAGFTLDLTKQLNFIANSMDAKIYLTE